MNAFCYINGTNSDVKVFDISVYVFNRRFIETEICWYVSSDHVGRRLFPNQSKLMMKKYSKQMKMFYESLKLEKNLINKMFLY